MVRGEGCNTRADELQGESAAGCQAMHELLEARFVPCKCRSYTCIGKEGGREGERGREREREGRGEREERGSATGRGAGARRLPSMIWSDDVEQKQSGSGGLEHMKGGGQRGVLPSPCKHGACVH